MKLLSIILSMFILSLYVSQVLDIVDINTDKGCSTSCCAIPISQEQPIKNNEENSANNNCNPFILCSTCLDFTIPTFIAFIEPVENYIEQSTCFIQSSTPQFIYSVWRPPQFV